MTIGTATRLKHLLALVLSISASSVLFTGAVAIVTAGGQLGA